MSKGTNGKMLLALLLCSVPMVAAQVPAHPYPPYFHSVLLAHGIMAALAWVILIPLGGIIIRLFDFKGVFWIHTVMQLVAYAMFCFVFATGCWFSWLYGSFAVDHVIIGIIVFILASAQPFLGTFHHKNYRKYARRTWPSVLHIHLGRALVTVAIINGGLGLYIAENATKAQLQAYGAVSGIVWLSYILIVSFKETVDVEKYYERFVDPEVSSDDERGLAKEEDMRSYTIEARKFGVYEKET